MTPTVHRDRGHEPAENLSIYGLRKILKGLSGDSECKGGFMLKRLLPRDVFSLSNPVIFARVRERTQRGSLQEGHCRDHLTSQEPSPESKSLLTHPGWGHRNAVAWSPALWLAHSLTACGVGGSLPPPPPSPPLTLHMWLPCGKYPAASIAHLVEKAQVLTTLEVTNQALGITEPHKAPIVPLNLAQVHCTCISFHRSLLFCFLLPSGSSLPSNPR